MIQSSKGYSMPKIYSVTCNSCGISEDFEVNSWKELIDKMVESSWKFRKNKEEWEHYCADCTY